MPAASTRARGLIADALLLVTGLCAMAGPALGQPRAPAPLVRERAGDRPGGGTRQTSVYRGGPELVVAGRVRTGIQPKSVIVSPDGSRVYVLNFGRRDHENVRAYDARTLALLATAEFPGNACESAITADGRTLWVSNFRLGTLLELDAATLAVRGEVRVEQNPKFVAVSPDGSRVYVSNWSSRRVSVVDTRTRTVVQTLRTGVHPRGMAVRRDGTLLVAATEDDVIHEFAASDLHEVRRIPTCSFPRHVLFAAGEARYFVSCSGTAHVAWYAYPSGAREGIAPVGMNPRTIALSEDGRWLASANFTGRSVSLVDLRENTVRTSVFPGADHIVGLAMAPGPPLRIFATSWDSGELLALVPRAATP